MKYHGEVLDWESREFLIIEGEREGYCPICTLKINTGAIMQKMTLEPSQARDLARHLVEAANVAETKP